MGNTARSQGVCDSWEGLSGAQMAGPGQAKGAQSGSRLAGFSTQAFWGGPRTWRMAQGLATGIMGTKDLPPLSCQHQVK